MRKLGIAPKAHDFKEGSFFVSDWADTVTRLLKTTGAFKVVRGSSAQSIPTAVSTVILFNSVNLDTDSWYDSSTGKFTPKIPGYYWLESQIVMSLPATVSTMVCSLRLNGTSILDNYQINAGVAGTYTPRVGTLTYLNGDTDYAQISISQNTGVSQNVAVSASNHFTGFLVKAI